MTIYKNGLTIDTVASDVGDIVGSINDCATTLRGVGSPAGFQSVGPCRGSAGKAANVATGR